MVAYDPLATASSNTGYQTHYVNLAYTPAKAISLMITSKAFHTLPRVKSYGTYPADSVFDAFRVSYQQNLSEMNSAEEFYHSNSTTSNRVSVSQLKHTAGVWTAFGKTFLDRSTRKAMTALSAIDSSYKLSCSYE